MCYFIVAMSLLLFYNVENNKNKEKSLNELVWPRLSTLSISTFLSADSTALVSQMTASPGSPTTSQSSVCQIGGPVVRTSGSLYGGITGFNS